jgi:hypothetical protein
MIFQTGSEVDQYVGQTIFEEAKRVTKEMTKEPPMPNEKTLIHQR